MARVADDPSNDLWAPYLIHVADGTITRLPGLFVSPEDLAWSPDGTHLAFANPGRALTADGILVGEWGIYVIDADGTGITRLVDGEATGLAWLPD